MSRVVLYIAASIDGYIAGSDDQLDWLDSVGGTEEDYGYHTFYQSIDALIMGRRTYEITAGFEKWPYAGKPSVVLSRNPLANARPDVTVVNQSPAEAIDSLAAAGHQKIWLMGGGQLTVNMLQSGLIDDIILSIIPMTLGAGVPLFPHGKSQQTMFDLLRASNYPTGLVQLHYKKRTNDSDKKGAPH